MGWLGVAFFGLGFVVMPVMFFRSGPQVVIDGAGIEDRRWKIGVIPWEDILSLSLVTVKSSKFLRIELVEPEKYLARLPRWQRWLADLNSAMGYPIFAISFAGLSPGIMEVWENLQQGNRDFGTP